MLSGWVVGQQKSPGDFDRRDFWSSLVECRLSVAGLPLVPMRRSTCARKPAATAASASFEARQDRYHGADAKGLDAARQQSR
jgi:hypothetical protein